MIQLLQPNHLASGAQRRGPQWRTYLTTQDSTFGGHFAPSRNGPQTCGPDGPGLSGASPRKAQTKTFSSPI